MCREAGRARLEHRPERRKACCAHRGERQPVIGAVPGDDFDFVWLAAGLPVKPCGLERGLGGLGAAAREEEGIDGREHQPAQALGQRDRGLVGAARIRGMERECRHLPPGGVSQLLPPVADVHVPEARETVDVLASGRILDQGAVARDPDPGRGVRRRVMQRMKEMRAIGIERVADAHLPMLPRASYSARRVTINQRRRAFGASGSNRSTIQASACRSYHAADEQRTGRG